MKGKVWHWCQKCADGKGRWTLSHKTADHKVGFMREQKQKKKDEDAGGGGGATGDGNLHSLPAGVLDQDLWVEK